MIAWEYLIVALAAFDTPKDVQGGSAAVTLLNEEGKQGWEAVGLTTRATGECAVLMKRVLPAGRLAGGRI